MKRPSDSRGCLFAFAAYFVVLFQVVTSGPTRTNCSSCCPPVSFRDLTASKTPQSGRKPTVSRRSCNSSKRSEPIRFVLIGVLEKIDGKEASVALAQRALFD